MDHDKAFAAALTLAKGSAVDPPRARALLGAQVSVLDELFHELARRAVEGYNPPDLDGQTRLLLAFKAQTQLCSALAAMAKLPDTPPALVAAAPGQESSNPANEQLEPNHGERLDP